MRRAPCPRPTFWMLNICGAIALGSVNLLCIPHPALCSQSADDADSQHIKSFAQSLIDAIKSVALSSKTPQEKEANLRRLIQEKIFFTTIINQVKRALGQGASLNSEALKKRSIDLYTQGLTDLMMHYVLPYFDSNHKPEILRITRASQGKNSLWCVHVKGMNVETGQAVALEIWVRQKKDGGMLINDMCVLPSGSAKEGRIRYSDMAKTNIVITIKSEK